MRYKIATFCLIIFFSYFIFFNKLHADNIRNITISNQCDTDVLWGVTGIPIKNNNALVKCTKANTECFNNQGICGNNNICYFKYPTLMTGKDDKPDFYLKPGVSKDYEIILINTNDTDNKSIYQYQINLGTQHQCSYNQETQMYECKSGDCTRDNSQPFNGQCSPTSGLQIPHTQAEIIFNNKNNDFYHVNLAQGANIPISITPIGEFGDQISQNPLFCTVTGALPTGHPNKMSGCTWKFNPPFNNEINQHIFTQITRDINSDITVACQTDAECSNGLKCGLKYPEDLKNYHYSAYCGVPVGYYTVNSICSLDNVSPELQYLFKCEHVLFDQTNQEFPVPLNENDPVEKRCPNSFTTLSLKGVPDSEQQFCNYELLQCIPKSINIAGKNYKYLDSCYNYSSSDPESSACCGCIDWPNIPSNQDNLCLTSIDQDEPALCNIDFSVKPPECKKSYQTKISAPNTQWLALVKPYLQWLIEGCPDAAEYQYGHMHSKLQCSSKNTPSEPGNNMNYLITLCPNGKNLFSNEIKATNVTINYNKNSFSKADKYNNTQDTHTIDLASIIIFVVFTLLVIILVVYYASRRDT